VRVFLACRIEAPDAAHVHAALEPFHRIYTGEAYRFVPSTNYHVTLRFFGDLPRAAVDRVVELIEPIAVAAAPIHCRTAAPQPLPPTRRPSVIVLPIGSAGRLEQLAATCNDVLAPEFGPPDKLFKAHLTVIRCRRGAKFVAPARDLVVPLLLRSAVVFESTSFDGAPRYTPLWQRRLGGGF
jgi:2'-5' RNA ligase